MTPAEIRLLFQSSAPAAELPPDDVEDVGDDDDDDDDDGLPAAERARRTAVLRQVLSDIQNTWRPGSSELNLAVEYLGDGSRDTSWRRSIGASGLLNYFLGLLASADDLPLPLKIHSLRLVGNSCADQDANRARVADGAYLGRLVSLLQDDSVLPFAIPVLYNICVDYEPAQLQASQACLSSALVAILAGPRLAKCAAVLGVVCKLLALLVTQEPETAMADPATPAVLLRLAADPAADLDAEEFALLVNVALAYLSYETFQEHLIRQDAVLALLTTFSDVYQRYDVADMDPDDANDYRALGTRFLNVLSDLTALELFAAAHPLTSSAVVQRLQSWIADDDDGSSSSSSRLLQTAACVALGNLSRSDQASTFFVHDVGIHVPLARLLLLFAAAPPDAAAPTRPSRSPGDGAAASVASAQETATAQLAFAVLSFLKNLAIPPANRPHLGAAVLLDADRLPRLWAGATADAQPQIQLAAVSLARLLVTACPANVVRMAAPSSGPDRSPVHVLLALFRRSDAENIRTEAARALQALCRGLHSEDEDGIPVLPDAWEPEPEPASASASASASESTEHGAATLAQRRRACFYEAHADLAGALGFLVAQMRFPALRPETWFVAALMCRSDDGARLVLRALLPEAPWGALVAAVSGDGDAGTVAVRAEQTQPPQLPQPPQPQADPEQAAATARAERENALVLLAELVKGYADQLPADRQSQSEQLLQTGGALVVGARGQLAGPGGDGGAMR